MNENATISDYEALNFALEHGIINMDVVREQMKKQKEKEILKNHPYSIWQGKDNRWRTYLPDASAARGKRLIAKTNREDLEAAIVKAFNEEENQLDIKKFTLDDIFPDWLEYKRLHTTAETYITRIQSDWNTHYKDTDIIQIPLIKLDKLTLDCWAHKLIQDNNLTKNAYYNITVIMRQCLNYAVDKGYISSNPFSSVKIDSQRMFRKVQKKQDETQVFLKSEQKSILPLAWDDFYNKTKNYVLAPLALLFQFQTGIRIGELCVIRYEDLTEQNGYIHIQRMLRRDTAEVVSHTKTAAGDRFVPLTSEAQKLIDTARQYQKDHHYPDNGYIFSINDKPLTERCISTLYTKYCKKLGIIQKSSHKARKTFVSNLISNGVNINTVRQAAGHADEKTTYNNYCYDTSEEDEKKMQFEKALSL